ncbi:MAG TPA: hypothetical protein VIH14_03775, partial [Anaerolineales bacterium]
TNAAQAVLSYLDTVAPKGKDAIEALTARIGELKEPVVSKADLTKLEAIETARAAELNLPEFKFDNNEAMLAAMGKLQTEQG